MKIHALFFASLPGIKAELQEVMKDPDDIDITNEAKKLFYVDVPKAEIKAIDRLMAFYLDKLSQEQEDQKDTDDNFA